MKRANSQKDNQSVLLPTAVLQAELGHLKQVSPDSNRRVCTSAAMIGLAAISMGFPNLLFPEGQQAARAAEPAALDPNQTTDHRASQPSLTGGGISTTVASPGFNAVPASLGNSPVIFGDTGVTTEETLNPASALVTSQPPAPVSLLEDTPQLSDRTQNQEAIVSSPLVLTPGQGQESAQNTPVAQPEEQKQAALDEAVNYLKVLESVNPESSRITILPSGKTTPKVQDLSVEESSVPSPSPSVSVIPQEATQAKLEKVGAVKPSWENRQTQLAPESATTLDPDWTVKAETAPKVQVNAAPEKVTLELYQVESGDTLDTIAQNHGVESSTLIQANQLSDPDKLEVNQSLALPRFESSSSVIPSTEVEPSLTWKSSGELQTLQEFDGTAKPLTEYPSIPSTETLPSQPLAPLTSVAPALEEVEVSPETAEKETDVSEFSAQTKEQSKDIPSVDVGSTQIEPELPNLPTIPSLDSTPIASTFNLNNSGFPQARLHQVQRGETLDSIARRYGVTRSELIRVNQITNPNLIRVNQNLKIPSSNALDSTTATALIPGNNNTQISSADLNPRQPVALVDLSPSSSAKQFTTYSDGNSSSYSTYVEGLTTEINQLRQQYQNQPASVTLPRTQPSTPVTPVASPAPVEPVNPEFAPSSSSASGNLEAELQRLQEQYRSSSPSAPTDPTSGGVQNVAVAPLGPDAYDPSKLPIGEMVSPEVPPLAPSERYLPGDRMNGYIWPAQGVFTSGYGWRWGRMHRGIDIAGPIGTPIFAAAPGVVDYADWNSGGYGYLVDIRHPDGSLTRYAHNNRLLVRKGQRVRQGQQIAEMGSTGYSTGPHLHFEIHPAGQGAVNPMAYLPNR
ncbi:peptidoglycan DD-metalloendopeptidase family protein [Roseofilum capinflatum]|uniref:Peptidoglycan DD-metalloendopeptidase family protein n=1 Tax=Roseofilum capinflatum BLCC-M114 TaxID=3022440 RepID=A0ABT7B8R9_9CYAN|nr:peptidoglycan DD-metalloendopeptidase family protein [Roseofilum capinflatum]MDJ1175573.1 peptidoglycan DD-metalloendopeptidase family protein [Roseofilum capinflatum BLCC-M114]